MKITIVGAGNMGLCLIGCLSGQDHKVTLFTSTEKLKNRTLVLKDSDNGTRREISEFIVSSSVEFAFRDVDLVFCTYPAFLRKEFIKKIENIISSSAIVCFVPGYGGAEYLCKKMIDRGVTICGFQRVPYVARYEINGDILEANILSAKKRLYVSTIPQYKNIDVAAILESILNIPVTILREYLEVTLCPSNPLLHISGLYNIFGKPDSPKDFTKELKFYEEWNDATSDFLMRYDEELHKICDAMSPDFSLDGVVPLSVYYESNKPKEMTHKLKSIEAFKVVKVPLKLIDGDKYSVDLDSRMFVEDFPFGVCMFKAFALITNVKTPIIDELLKFYADLSGKIYFNNDGSLGADIDETGIPQLIGITSLQNLLAFYKGV